MKTPKKILTVLFCLSIMIAMLASCGPARSNVTFDRDTLIIAMEAEPASLHVFNHQNFTAAWVNLMTFATLLYLNPETNMPEPHLVEEWEIISDTVIELKLQEGIKFHNGETMTSADVKASIEYAQTYTETATYTSGVADVIVIDDLTFRIVTREPNFLIFMYMTGIYFSVLPKSLIDAGHDFHQEPIGAGPYRQIEYSPGDKIVYEAFEDYFDQTRIPRIRNVTYRIIPEGTARTIALETGDVNYLHTVNTADIPRLQNTDGITVETSPGITYHFLALNHERSNIHLNNPMVRRAIDMAINKDDLVLAFANGFGIPAYNQVHFNIPGTSSRNINRYDPEAARAVLAETGINPSEIRFQINVNNDAWRRMAEIIQSQLRRELGIEVTRIEQLDMPAHIAKVNSGDFDGAQTSYIGYHALVFLHPVVHSTQVGGFNRSRIRNPDFDRMIEAASNTMDIYEANSILEELTAQLNEMTLHIPLVIPDIIKAYHSDLVAPGIDSRGNLQFHTAYWR